jgi:uncharacterized protein (DUF1501 family)
MTNQSRRDFLKTSAAATVAAPLVGSMLAMQQASAATYPTDYKALVCVYLAGGNDAYNTLVYGANHPSRATYAQKRQLIHLAVDQLLDLGAAGQNMAFNKQLDTLYEWFQPGSNKVNAAVVANVGTLIEPVTQQTYAPGNVKNLPKQLFSHNDQTSIWLTGDLEGNGIGWGGGMIRGIDEAVPSGAGDFKSISINRQTAFCSAAPVSNFVADARKGILPPGKWSADGLSTAADGIRFWGAVGDDSKFLKPVLYGDVGMSTINGVAGGHLLEKDYVNVMQRAYDNYLYLKVGTDTDNPAAKLPDVAYESRMNGNPLWSQLAMVANCINNNTDINVKRQVFFVELGGFDTHSGQARDGNADVIPSNPRALSPHDALLRQLNDALKYFYEALGETHRNSVTTFTASEFGRKLLENGDGCDHGWGGHHFVVGGNQVNAGTISGKVPNLNSSLSDPQLVATDGTMIPAVSVEQFGWELAEWFGVPPDKREEIFPGYFQPAANMLSFMA